jgi:hypothetical protein
MSQRDLVAFLDILGYKAFINSYINGNNSNIIQIIENAMEEAKKSANSYGNINPPITINLKQFSDCSCVSIPDSSNNHQDPEEQYLAQIVFMLSALRSFQIELLDSKIYIRGGLSFGFHKETSNIIFSEGLVKAYELESEKAIYPRIVLDEKLADIIKNYYQTHKNILSHSGIYEILLIDSEGIIFLNPFNYYVSLKNNPNVYDMLKKSGNPNVHEFLKKPHYDQSELESVLKELDSWYFNDIVDDIKKQMEKNHINCPKIFERHDWLIEIIVNLLSNFNHFKKLKNDFNIYKKYEWLYELSLWTNDPKSSKTKFHHFLK